MNIIGKSECTAAQMAAYLIARNPNARPWALEYAKLYLEEGASENIRGDGAWVQSCKETHYFIFDCGTAVTFDQNNFCGLGVTRKGLKGHSFATPRLGIRAQIQHLKGYATAIQLVNECIDPRYKYVKKGVAPTFELLAGKWAVPGYDTSKYTNLQDALNNHAGYGYDIIKGIEEIKKINTNTTEGGQPMIFNIHAGHNPHGMRACGAVGLISESTEARKVKTLVVHKLRALGHTVYDCTVDNGTSQNDVLRKIVTKCNAHKVDLDISIHFNSGAKDLFGNKKTTGTEVFTYSNNSKANTYAKNIVDNISALGFKNRGLKHSKSLYVLRKTMSPSMLIEICFVDDKDDVLVYDANKVADAIINGILGKTVTNDTNQSTSPTENNQSNYSLVFNSTYYANKYPDLKAAFGYNAPILLQHFIQSGMKEGRQAISTFNVHTYKNRYIDLQKAFGNDLPSYYKHFITCGYKEGRKGV